MSLRSTLKTTMTDRCPKTARPSQFRGRAKYRFAGVTLQCVLEEGHAGPCGMEPLPQAPIAKVDRVIDAVLTERPVKVWSKEEIAAADERYREHLRRKARG